MNARKLFQVLVIAGTLSAGGGCGPDDSGTAVSPAAAAEATSQGDGGAVAAADGTDGGVDVGGGTCLWGGSPCPC